MDDHVTGTMYLDSNELERQPAHTFLTKWTFNNKSCGTGKTKKDSDNIKYFVKKGMKILVCLSNHRLIEEFIERMEYKCEYIHLKGKLQPLMCNKENPNPDAFLNGGCNNCKEIYGVWDEEKNDFMLLGYSPLDFLKDIETFIFNCATTKLSLAENTFGRNFDAIIKDKEVMENPIYILDDVMTMTKTEVAIPLLVEILDLCNIPKDNTTVIYCKKNFEVEISQLLPEIHTGHYGDCRGSNRFEECKNVVLFGRFALRDSVKWLLSLYGLTQEEIKSMEEAEEIQALHRVRPLLDKEVRIFLFTNTLMDKIPNATEVFNKRHLDKCLEILNRKEELEGLNKTDIYDKIKGDHNDTKRSLEILEHFNKIKPIFGYGAKLTFV